MSKDLIKEDELKDVVYQPKIEDKKLSIIYLDFALDYIGNFRLDCL